MRKKIIFFIIVVVVCLVTWGLYLYNKPRVDISKQKAEITIDAGKLYSEYAANEQKADSIYLDKIIAVTGKVVVVNATDSIMNLLIGNDNTIINGVSCSVAINKGEAIKINKGEAVIIKGKCTGFLNDVMLADCVIEK